MLGGFYLDAFARMLAELFSHGCLGDGEALYDVFQAGDTITYVAKLVAVFEGTT